MLVILARRLGNHFLRTKKKKFFFLLLTVIEKKGNVCQENLYMQIHFCVVRMRPSRDRSDIATNFFLWGAEFGGLYDVMLSAILGD